MDCLWGCHQSTRWAYKIVLHRSPHRPLIAARLKLFFLFSALYCGGRNSSQQVPSFAEQLNSYIENGVPGNEQEEKEVEEEVEAPSARQNTEQESHRRVSCGSWTDNGRGILELGARR